jgi:hypothetical protein
MEGIVFYGTVLALLVFKLWWDWKAKNIDKRIINHFRSALIDVGVYCFVSFGLFGLDFWKWVLLACSIRWIAFDTIFNLINGDKWDHYGKSSTIDRFMTKLGKFHLVLKLTLLIAGITLAYEVF